jgi:hypothetical protein
MIYEYISKGRTMVNITLQEDAVRLHSLLDFKKVVFLCLSMIKVRKNYIVAD